MLTQVSRAVRILGSFMNYADTHKCVCVCVQSGGVVTGVAEYVLNVSWPPAVTARRRPQPG